MSFILKKFPDGVERGLKFNQIAIVTFAEANEGKQDKYGVKANCAMVYSGLVGDYFAKQKEEDFTFEQVVDWVDEMTATDLNEIAAVLMKSTAFQKTAEAGKEETKKNAAPKKQTKNTAK